jgi:hypothetical protein
MFHPQIPARRRIPAILTAAGLITILAPAMSGAFAQDAPPPAPPPAAEHGPTMREKFAAANTTHDGHLTREQAQAGGMKMVAKYFDAIDVNHRGYVTLQDIRAFSQARRAERQGPPPADAPPPPPPPQ